MNKWKKILMNATCGILGFLLLVIILFCAIRPGVPIEKINETGKKITALELPNGEYIGEDVFNLLHGQGVFTFNTGEVYEGNWKLHNMSGKGKLTTTMGIYEGEFIDSKREGEGTFTWADGTHYIGSWIDDKMCGNGEIQTPQKISYKGSFSDNSLRNGTIQCTTDAFSFSIDVKDGEMDSQISVKFSDGVTYEGEYSETSFSGEGIMTFPNVGTYDGEFLAGKRSGHGEFTWEDGARYDGDWEEDVFEGEGVYHFDSATSISGVFENGQLNGNYRYKNSNGIFNTVWIDGKCTSIVLE